MIPLPLRFGFQVRPLDSRLFREGSTPLIDKVKLRNEVLQKVIRRMSLTRPGPGPKRQGLRAQAQAQGTHLYAQLGINQLGAVYEALLSYRGFFAEETCTRSRRPASHTTTWPPLFS